jgi:hypothetical protein
VAIFLVGCISLVLHYKYWKNTIEETEKKNYRKYSTIPVETESEMRSWAISINVLVIRCQHILFWFICAKVQIKNQGMFQALVNCFLDANISLLVLGTLPRKVEKNWRKSWLSSAKPASACGAPDYPVHHPTEGKNCLPIRSPTAPSCLGL